MSVAPLTQKGADYVLYINAKDLPRQQKLISPIENTAPEMPCQWCRIDCCDFVTSHCVTMSYI